MISRGQVYVRAKSPSGKWGSHDVLDLDEESFRSFALTQLARMGAVAVVMQDGKWFENESFELRSTVELSE